MARKEMQIINHTQNVYDSLYTPVFIFSQFCSHRQNHRFLILFQCIKRSSSSFSSDGPISGSDWFRYVFVFILCSTLHPNVSLLASV